MKNYNQEVLFEGKIYAVLYEYDTGYMEIREKGSNEPCSVKFVHMSEVTFLKDVV